MGSAKLQSGMSRREVLKGVAAVGALTSLPEAASAVPVAAPTAGVGDDRRYWVEQLTRVSDPVLRALAGRKLKATMPVEAPQGNVAERAQFTHLEAFGRLVAGIAPWLETGPSDGAEGTLRREYAELARAAMDAATDPASADFMNFHQGTQPVVDTAFLTLGILRAPTELWAKLTKTTQQNVIRALQASRAIKPGYNNWLLFSAMVEAGLSFMGQEWDAMRVDYAVRSMEAFYKGDGMYGDGVEFHWDYYNSYVMHPMLLTVLEAVGRARPDWKPYEPKVLARAQRYAAIQERLISPEGTLPAIGRSLAYRAGALHHLAHATLNRQLPKELPPAQVRCAMTAVMRRMMDAPGTFDAKGWLNIGFCGHQPQIAESYISTGSSYLCSVAWLPLGLPATDVFWSGAPEMWSSQKVWSGVDVPADHALGG